MMRKSMVVLFALAGCGPAPARPAPKVAARPVASPQEAGKTAVRPGGSQGLAMGRSALEAVLRKGPGWLFAQVPIEEVMKKGKFVGWRLLELPAGWEGPELQSGDVVTAVNAMPIEKPDQLWAAWTSLSVASELKIAMLRDGKPHELRVPIVGEPDQKLARELRSDPTPPAPAKGAAPAAGGPRRKQTVIIKGDDRPLSDTLVDWSQ